MKFAERMRMVLVLLGLAVTLRAEPPARPLHLFLLVGQSNMAGRGEINPADNAPLAHVWVWGPEDRWIPAVEPYHWDKSMAGAGLAKSFAQAYLAEHPGVDIGLIPAACGGSALSDWAVGAYFEGTQSHPWTDAVRRARLAMIDGTLEGMLWHQGESDGWPERAPRYEVALGELLQRFRLALNAPGVPIVLGQIGRFTPDAWGGPQQQVDAANHAVAAADPRVSLVTSEGLTSKPDGIHFNTPSLRELGRRYYAAWRDVTRE